MGLTTVQFWKQQLDSRLTAQAAAQSGLRTAQELQKDSAANLNDALAALDAGAAQITARRAQLAVTTIPAEAEALIKLLTKDVIAQRALQGAVLDHKAKLGEADAQATVASAALVRIAAQISAARAAGAQSATEDKQRESLKTAIAVPPLPTIAADATSLLGSATATNAKKRVDANFPTAMQDIAGARVTTRRGHVARLRAAFEAAQDAQAAALAADHPRSGAVQQAWLALQRTQAALADTVASGPARYAKARSLLQQLEAIELAPAHTVPDVLTEAELAARKLLDKAGADTKTTVTDLDKALGEVFKAQDDLDAAVLAEIASPGTIDMAAKRAAVASAEARFASGLAAFPAAKKNDLDQWEAVIPDPAWRILLDYIDGLAALEDLKGVNLATMASQMKTDEEAYTKALGDAELAQRRADDYADAVALRAARLAAARAAVDTRVASAIRGDSY